VLTAKSSISIDAVRRCSICPQFNDRLLCQVNILGTEQRVYCSCWWGRQMRVGWLTTAIFGDLSGYFFGNFRDKASNII